MINVILEPIGGTNPLTTETIARLDAGTEEGLSNFNIFGHRRTKCLPDFPQS
jgi:hypothetical protein